MKTSQSLELFYKVYEALIMIKTHYFFIQVWVSLVFDLTLII